MPGHFLCAQVLQLRCKTCIAILRLRTPHAQITAPRINRVYFSILSGKDSIDVVVVTRIDCVYFVDVAKGSTS